MITIFTATYNRGEKLQRLYKSLINQTYKDFDWLIIDDGSTDNTKKIIDTYIQENLLKINYIYKENGGKHRAINKALDIAKGELFYIVDSDDYLPYDSLENIIKKYNEVRFNDSFIGIAGIKSYEDGNIIGNAMNEDVDMTYFEYRFVKKIKGDKAEVMKTNILKKFRIMEFESEKFMSEGSWFLDMATEGYKFRWFNQSIYIAEYLEDGLSKNLFNNRLKNWNGYVYFVNKILKEKLSKYDRVRYLSNYYRMCYHKKLKKSDCLIENLRYRILCKILGNLLYLQDIVKMYKYSQLKD